MTPEEAMLWISCYYEREQKREERLEEMLAWFTHNLMAPHAGKKTPKPRDLVRKREQPGAQEKQEKTEEDKVVDFERRRKLRAALSRGLQRSG